MNIPDTVILYHVYGSTALYNQLRFSILTLYHQLKGDFKNMKVVIYTDDARNFEMYKEAMPFYIEPLTKDSVQSYKGEQQFVHRVKICVIKDCFLKYKSNILYLDSDTYLTKNPLPLLNCISGTTSIMNSNDYDLISADDLYENNDWLHIRKAIKNYVYIIEGKKTTIPLTTRMWNAGVIGISKENSHLLDNILELTDQIYKNKRVFTAEQLAFSYYLQNKTDLISSEDVVFHYWRNFYGSYWKNSHDFHFRKFFNQECKKSINDQAVAAYQLTLEPQKLMQMPNPSLLQKIIKRFNLLKKVAIKGKL